MKNNWIFLVLFGLLWLTSSCRDDVDASLLKVYDGPVNEASNVHLITSDSAIVRSEIMAAKQLEFADGNIEFPEGIDINIFDKDGELSTTMRADRGYFYQSENLYKGVGDVRVHNLQEDQSLKSEELFWSPREKRIYTEKFVTIQDKQTLFNGSGMEADETFTNYSFKNPRDSRTVLPGEEL